MFPDIPTCVLLFPCTAILQGLTECRRRFRPNIHYDLLRTGNVELTTNKILERGFLESVRPLPLAYPLQTANIGTLDHSPCSPQPPSTHSTPQPPLLAHKPPALQPTELRPHHQYSRRNQHRSSSGIILKTEYRKERRWRRRTLAEKQHGRIVLRRERRA